MTRLVLQIDRVVLDGVSIDAGKRPSIHSGLQSEMARLVSERGLAAPVGSGSRPSMRCPEIVVSGEPDAVALGRLIGRALFEGMTNEL